MVENVERLATKLKPHMLTKSNVFRHSKVNTEGWRSLDDAATCGSRQCSKTRQPCIYSVSRIQLEARCVEILLNGMGSTLIWIAQYIRTSSWVSIDQAGTSEIKV